MSDADSFVQVLIASTTACTLCIWAHNVLSGSNTLLLFLECLQRVHGRDSLAYSQSLIQKIQATSNTDDVQIQRIFKRKVVKLIEAVGKAHSRVKHFTWLT